MLRLISIRSAIRARHYSVRTSASTQNQALAACLFLYRNVLGRRMDWIEPAVRAKRPERLPVVLTRGEVSTLLYGRGDGMAGCIVALRRRLAFDGSSVSSHQGLGFYAQRNP